MSGDGSFWSGVAVMGVLAASLYYCTRENEPSQPRAMLTDYSASNAAANANSVVPSGPASPIPAHNYSDKEDSTYYYVAAVSEEERKKGQASGAVNSYQYDGKDDSGAHIVLAPGVTYKCAVPCKIIKGSNGNRIAYNEDSMIGAVFQDAMRGHLKPVPRAPKPKPVVETPMTEAPTSKYQDSSEVLESPGGTADGAPSTNGTQVEPVTE